MHAEHIIIIRFSAMGDVAMTLPVVYSLAKQYPDLRISVLSRPFARAFFESIAPNVDFMEADLKGEYKGIKGLNRLYRRLIAKHPTAVADFHNVLRTKFLRQRFHLDGIKTAHIDKHKEGKRLLCRRRNKVFVQQPTSFSNYQDVLKELGYPVRLSFQSIFPKEGGDLSTLSPVVGTKPSDCQWIGIAPFAAHQGKMYPQEKMERVIDLLVQRIPTCRIFLFGGGKKEKDILGRWAEKHSQCISAASTLNGLKEELTLISHLDVMVSMDSANMHLASLTGTRVVSVWGATHPYCGFMGWQQSPDDAVQDNGLSCRPCSVFGNKPCHRGDLACINSIRPEDIVEKVLSPASSRP